MTELNSPTRQEYAVPGLPAALSHYTDAVRFGDMLFVSGLTGHDANGALIGEDDAASQAQQIFENLGRILDAAGARPSDILKITVFLTDVADRVKINPVRQRYFGESKPASTLFGVSQLALPGMKVEIEAVVGLPSRRSAVQK